MKINKLQLQNFKRFENKQLAFSDGLNVIYGENEKGKSTIIDAILAFLFTDPATASKMSVKNSTWNKSTGYKIDGEFAIADEHYKLIKDFQNKKAVLTKQGIKR